MQNQFHHYYAHSNLAHYPFFVQNKIPINIFENSVCYLKEKNKFVSSSLILHLEIIMSISGYRSTDRKEREISEYFDQIDFSSSIRVRNRRIGEIFYSDKRFCTKDHDDGKSLNDSSIDVACTLFHYYLIT